MRRATRPTLQSALADLADRIEGEGWKTKPSSAWTAAESAAYQRWEAAELEAMRGSGIEPEVRVTIVKHGEEPPEEEIGEVFRPTTEVTIVFDRRSPDNAGA